VRPSLGLDEVGIFIEARPVVGRSVRFAGLGPGVDRAPPEHRRRSTSVPNPVIIMTSGLHTAPVSATEHRSSADQSTRDSQTILLPQTRRSGPYSVCAARDSNPDPLIKSTNALIPFSFVACQLVLFLQVNNEWKCRPVSLDVAYLGGPPSTVRAPRPRPVLD